MTANAMSSIEYDFSGHNAVVTGGASGIGRDIAARLSMAGAHVVVWDVSAFEDDGDGDDGVAVAVLCDVADPASVAAAYEETTRRVGVPTLLVNAAGIIGRRVPVADLDVEEWDRIQRVDLRGVLIVTRALLAGLRGRGGRIVNIASMTGLDGNDGYAAYSAAKAAVINLTQVLGKELAGEGIFVNAVAPGMVDTGFVVGMDSDYIAGRRAKSALGRLIRPAEVSSAVLWLLSDESSFLTGYTMPLAGGRL